MLDFFVLSRVGETARVAIFNPVSEEQVTVTIDVGDMTDEDFERFRQDMESKNTIAPSPPDSA